MKEPIRFCHPYSLLVIFYSRTGSIIKGPYFAVASIRKIAVSIFWTPAVLCAVSFLRIPDRAWARSSKTNSVGRFN
jgi:hypothetical protein